MFIGAPLKLTLRNAPLGVVPRRISANFVPIGFLR
jgi:hypothetical protein